jgi:hypothetical protein
MATSNSFDFSITRDQLLSRAFEAAGIVNEGATLTPAQIVVGSQLLNMLAKQWSGNSDFSGVKMQSRKRGYLFLNTGQSAYTLGPTVSDTGTTDKWASSYVTTTIGTAEAAAQTVLSLTSSTGIVSSNRIGIELDNGAIQWSTVSSLSGNDVTIADSSGLSGAAAAGNRVFAYSVSAEARRPLSILTAVLRDTNTTDIPMYPMSLARYEEISSKITDGTPSRYYYEPALVDGVLYLNAEPDDVTKVIRMVYVSPIADFDGATDTPDMPQEWYLPLTLKMAMLVNINYRMPVSQDLKDAYAESLLIARNLNPETSELYFQSNA